MSDLELSNIKSKLLWSVSNGYAAHLAPSEAEKLLTLLANPTPTGTVDVRRVPKPYPENPAVNDAIREQRAENARLSRITRAQTESMRPHIGDPGDEQPE